MYLSTAVFASPGQKVIFDIRWGGQACSAAVILEASPSVWTSTAAKGRKSRERAQANRKASM